MRVSGFQHFDACFADNPNPGTGIQGANDFRVRGGRGSTVFTPSDTTKLTYFRHLSGNQAVRSDLPDLDPEPDARHAEPRAAGAASS